MVAVEEGRPVRDRRFFVAVAVVVGVGALDIAWNGFHFGGDRATQYFTDLIGIPVTIVVALACWFAARRQRDPRTRWGWTLLGAGVFAWGVGEAVWSYYELRLNMDVPFPSWADAGYLALIPLAATGLALLHSVSRRYTAGVRAALEGMIIVTSVLFISWASVLGPVYRTGEGSLLEKAIGLTYPIGDVVILAIVLFTATRAVRGDRGPLILIGAGLISLAVADSLFTYFNLHGAYQSGSAFDAWWDIARADAGVRAKKLAAAKSSHRCGLRKRGRNH